MNTALQNSKLKDKIQLPSEKQFKRGSHKGIKLALEVVLLPLAVIGIVELFLSVASAGQQEYLQPDPILGMVHIPGKRVTWRMEGFSNDAFNTLGERDIEHSIAKPKGVTRIALVGDSATEGLQVPLKQTYARKLQKKLDQQSPGRFEVLNFACASYSTGQQLIKMRNTVAKYQPDLTVYLYNRHDACDSVHDPTKKFVDPRPYFYLDDKKSLQQDNSILEAESARLAPNAVSDFLRRNSRIYGVMMQTDLYLGVNEPLYRTIRNGLKAGMPAHPKPAYVPNPFLVMIELIKDMNRECTATNSEFAVLMFPKTLEDPLFSTQAAYIQKESKRHGFHFLDLSRAFADSSSKEKLFLQVHFSDAGHELVAQKLLESLYDWKLIGKDGKN